MKSQSPAIQPPRNPITHQRHRREVFWQITIPSIAAALLLLIFAILATGLTEMPMRKWADISLISLIIPAGLFSLLGLVFLAVGVYATARLIQVLPGLFYRLHGLLILIGARLSRLENGLVEPVLRIQSWNASLRMLWKSVKRKKH